MAKKIREHEGQDIYSYIFTPEVKALDDFTIEMIGSTEAKDRDGEVLLSTGWDLKNFKKNPVVLLNHDYHSIPVGKAKVSIKDKKLMFKIEFPQEGKNPQADIVRHMYKDGFMHASSVGFIPIDYKIGEKPKDPIRTYTKQELLEISLVTVPANPTALLSGKSLQDGLKKGLYSDKDLDFLRKESEEIKEEQEQEADTVSNGQFEKEATEKDSTIQNMVMNIVNAEIDKRMQIEAGVTLATIERKIQQYESVLVGKAIEALHDELNKIRSQFEDLKMFVTDPFAKILSDPPPSKAKGEANAEKEPMSVNDIINELYK